MKPHARTHAKLTPCAVAMCMHAFSIALLQSSQHPVCAHALADRTLIDDRQPGSHHAAPSGRLDRHDTTREIAGGGVPTDTAQSCYPPATCGRGTLHWDAPELTASSHARYYRCGRKVGLRASGLRTAVTRKHATAQREWQRATRQGRETHCGCSCREGSTAAILL